jgi:mono/diheme cytochrome c family protein
MRADPVMNLCLILAAASAAAARPADALPAGVGEAFLETHCIACHCGPDAESGLDLESLSRDGSDREARERWALVHDRIAAGEMPPADEPRPPEADRLAMLGELTGWLEAADAAARGREGRAVTRRLTAAEYENALRDLLAVPELDVRRLLPADGTRHGFDKVGDGLDLSHVQLEQYLAAADRALDMAIATRATPPPVLSKRFDIAGMLKFRQNLRSGAAVLLNGLEPERGWYHDGRKDPDEPKADGTQALLAGRSVGFFTPKLGGHEKYISFVPIHSGRYRMRMSIWSFVWNHGTVEPSPRTEVALLEQDTRVLGYFDAASLEPRVHELTVPLVAGRPPMFDVASLAWRRDGSRDHRPGIAIDWFEVEGPLHDQWPPESHRRLFGELPIRPFDPATGGRPPARRPISFAVWAWPRGRDVPPGELDRPVESVASDAPAADATRLLAAFLPRAFRRPVSDEEVARHAAIALDRLAKGDCFEDAMRQAYKAALVSPHFLFRRESPGPLDDHALATRLALWLWNGPPDDDLLAAAAAGSLREPASLAVAVDRLLADPRSERFVRDFLDQWLNLKAINDTDPDKKLYPEFQFRYLKDSMLAESRSFFRELLDTDAPITSLITTDFAMLNERLVQHYRLADLPGEPVEGSRIRRVPLPSESHRGGFLTQGAVLKVTANGTTTSPVIRGAFVSERILGQPIPPPPPNVPAVEPDIRGATTIREQLRQHQADTACAACHRKMDPPGFALESFDVIGGWRDRYRSLAGGTPASDPLFDGRKPRFRLAAAVDASGTLADGRSFADFEGFRQLLNADPERLARAFVTQLVIYATGGEPTFEDRAEIDRIVAATASNHYGVRSLVHAIAASRLFREK